MVKPGFNQPFRLLCLAFLQYVLFGAQVEAKAAWSPFHCKEPNYTRWKQIRSNRGKTLIYKGFLGVTWPRPQLDRAYPFVKVQLSRVKNRFSEG